RALPPREDRRSRNMPFWKPILLIVPAGLLAGTMAGEAIRPVPLVKEERPWPISVREKASAIEPWRPIYEGGPQDLNPGPSRYRPDLDYDVFAWPDRSDRSADYLAELGDVRSDRAVLQASHVSLAAPDLPQTE